MNTPYALEICKLSDFNLPKEGLDSFKKYLAKRELECTWKKDYWRLAFWQRINNIRPHITAFENKSRHLDSRYLSHNWHSFPAKFYPQLIRSLMNIYGVKEGQLVYDPYAGCGTTLVESKLMGLNCIGVDISKLAVLMSKVKLDLDINMNDILKEKNKITSEFSSMMINYEPKYSEFEEMWYNPHNRKQIKLLKNIIDGIKEERIKNFFTVGLSSILKRVANTKSGQIEIRYGYRNEDLNVLKLFNNKVDYMLRDLEKYQRNKKPAGNSPA